MAELERVEQSLRYEFQDRGLLRQALTHPSFAHEQGILSNEPLAFLGDRVLELAAAALILERLGPLPKGKLTTRLHRLIQARTLTRAARHLELEGALRVGVSRQGETTDRMLAQCFSGIVGALFLDSGLGAASTLARRSWEALALGAGDPGR